MSGRGLLLVLAGLFIAGSIFTITYLQRSEDLTGNLNVTYNYEAAKNIANTGAELAVNRLKNDLYRRIGFNNVSSQNGRYTVTLTDTTFNGEASIRVISTGVANPGTSTQATYTCTVYVYRGGVPPALKAAICTNNDIEASGNMDIDGRNHRLDGTVVPASGTYGIWTTKTFLRTGASDIGGTSPSGIDFAPCKTPPADIITTGQTYPGGYPSSPDSILGGPAAGYPEGKLKQIAQSGVNGSQYTTNPATLTYPLRGVTYIELPSGGSWLSCNIEGSGILVVHNSSVNAIMREVNSGTFRGIIVVDDILHVQSTIIGAIIGLSPSPSAGNCIGNGVGEVLYSSEAIQNTTGSLAGVTGRNVMLWKE